MLEFVPSIISENASDAEKKVFKLLQSIDLEGFVLHSFCLNTHESKVHGEIDFVILCELGILCLEVKGGGIECDEGDWYYTDRTGTSTLAKESPFKQAVSNMYALKKQLSILFKYNQRFKNLQYACGLVFPDVYFRCKSPEIDTELIFDSRYDSSDFPKFIEKIFNHWSNRCSQTNTATTKSISKTELNQIRESLRENFSIMPTLSVFIDDINHQQLLLTDEQYFLLDHLFTNPRVLISGTAGTGKTLMAMELAKQKSDKGEKILLLTYNKCIAKHIQSTLSRDLLSVYNFHDYLLYLCPSINPENYVDKDLFYNETLIEEFLSVQKMPSFDCIIIDEGQDLISTNFLLCIDLLLKNNLDSGSWYFFYDRNQNIYNSHFTDGLQALESNTHTKASLKINCRNTKQIATYNESITHIPCDALLKINGLSVESHYYKKPKVLYDKIRTLIHKLQNDGINLNDIAILSPRTFKNSDLSKYSSNPFESICHLNILTGDNYEIASNIGLKYCTIQSFKGLESDVIILVDFDKDKIDDKLLYVGISRSKAILHTFAPN